VGIPNPRVAIEYLTNDSTTFGPKDLDGLILGAAKVGWAWYSRFPATAFFTLRQDDPHNLRLLPLLHHIRIHYINDKTGYTAEVFNGRLIEPDTTVDDAVWEAFNYQAELALSRTAYRTLYPTKLLGTEVASPEWAAAKAATYSLFGHVDTGTIEDPLGSDGITPIRTDARFGVVDVPRLLFFFDLCEIGRANTANNVTFDITRTRTAGKHQFRFRKNAGSLLTTRRLTFPGNVRDYRYVPGYRQLRNDLATIGTTSAGGATEIVKTIETSSDGPGSAQVYGRRQDVFTIKTLSGLAGAATEFDAQTAITARAVREATNLSRDLALDLRPDFFEPFDGWDLEDTVRVQLERGRDHIDADYRIVGIRGQLDELGYRQQLIVTLPTAP
jgi:hypothetical protein